MGDRQEKTADGIESVRSPAKAAVTVSVMLVKALK